MQQRSIVEKIDIGNSMKLSDGWRLDRVSDTIYHIKDESREIVAKVDVRNVTQRRLRRAFKSRKPETAIVKYFTKW
jgi:hypothetical protein